MKEIRVPLERFDLEIFLARTVRFLKEELSPDVAPTSAMVWVERSGGAPAYGPDTGWDVLSALKLESKKVFFPFAYADNDGTLTCADGNTYGRVSDDEDFEEALSIGMEDCIGFLVHVCGRNVIISSAIHAGGACPGPPPSVDLREDCGVLEEPMAKYISRFLKS